MRVGLLTQYYPPEIGAPQRRLSQLAEGLVARGHSVVVLTAMPNYPMGKVVPGYGGVWREEWRGGARVLRTFIYPTQSARMARRLASYGSFALSALAVGLARLPWCDYLLVESPPLFLGPTGVMLSRARGARLIFNVSDLWPESAVRLGMLRPGRALWMSAWLEAFCYRSAWLVSGQSASIVEHIRARFPQTRTYLFSNGVDTSRFRPELANGGLAREHPERPVALYAGLHGLAQGLDQILEAAGRDGAGAEILLMGDGPLKAELCARARREGAAVRFLDPAPADAMPRLVASADIALVTLKGDIPGAVPSKLYEAMAAGRAVLMVASGEAAAIVARHEAGLVVAPGDTAGLRRALGQLASDEGLRARLGANGRRAAEQFYDRRAIVEKFARYLEECL